MSLLLAEIEKELVWLKEDNATLRARVDELEKALAWYGEQARLARLIHSEGDNGRHALSKDGGEIARAALKPKE